jgi:hypothetical protein
MVSIYILKLANSKYYVGKTTNINTRISAHLLGNGSEWTKLHKPIEVDKIIYDCDHFDEDKWTLIYMNKHGIENVRGGSFCKIFLDRNTQHVISNMITGSTDRCYLCNSKEHFAKECIEYGYTFIKYNECEYWVLPEMYHNDNYVAEHKYIKNLNLLKEKIQIWGNKLEQLLI